MREMMKTCCTCGKLYRYQISGQRCLDEYNNKDKCSDCMEKEYKVESTKEVIRCGIIQKQSECEHSCICGDAFVCSYDDICQGQRPLKKETVTSIYKKEDSNDTCKPYEIGFCMVCKGCDPPKL